MSKSIQDTDYSVISTYEDGKDEAKCAANKKNKSRTGFGMICLLFLAGIVNLIIGALSLRYDYLELVMNERIKMRPGLPAFETWRRPPVPIVIKVYIFAVTNPNEFLNSTEVKLKLEEIGPITYLKRIKQDDIVFNDDSTMSYTTSYDVEYPEHLNEPGILNRTIVVPNSMLIGMAALVHDNMLGKMAFDFIESKDTVFLTRSIYDVLWNFTCPTLEDIKKIPFVVPRPNAGILFNSLFPNNNRYNVNIGPKHGFEKFFQINTLNGGSKIPVYAPNYPRHCPFGLKGASEGTGFPPFMSKNEVINAYTDNLCRTYPMVYNREVRQGRFDCYEFVFRDDLYRRPDNPELDCLGTTNGVLLPDGLTDSSKCAFGTPVALSNPHFLGFEGKWNDYLEGMKPDYAKHSSRVVVEPKTGIQLQTLARIQANIPLPELRYYSAQLRRFSGMILPNYWLEYNMVFDDKVILTFMDIGVNYLPVLQPIIIVISLTLSAICLCKVTLRLTKSKITLVHWTKANGIEFPRICSNEIDGNDFGKIPAIEGVIPDCQKTLT